MKKCQAPWSLAGLLLALTLILAPPPLLAGSFSIKPVRVTLSSGSRVASMEVTNTSASKTSIQMETVAWTQDAQGKDQYTPTKALLATPPIFTLEPGQSQIIRVGLRRPPSGGSEVTFRLFLQEIPPPAEEGFTGLRMALRLGVPVFVHPQNSAAAQLRWSAKRLADGRLRLSVANQGNAHAQLADTTLTLSASESLHGKTSGYVLPGARRQWDIETTTGITGGDSLQIETRVNGKTQTATVRVE